MQYFFAKKYPTEGGVAMMIATIFFVVVSTLIVVGITGPAARGFRAVNDTFASKQSYFAAESGVEDVYYRYKNAVPVGSVNTLSLKGISVDTELVTEVSGVTNITATANAFGKKRTVEARVIRGTKSLFPYAVDAGHGGIIFTGGSVVSGSAYALGLIDATGSATITNSVYSSTVTGPTTHQTNGSGTPAFDFALGASASTIDAAESFVVTTASPVSQASFYIKKNGAPASATVSIVADNGGVPDTKVLATGTLLNTSVSTTYKWVNVTLAPNPVLDQGRLYWVVIHQASVSGTNYYTIGASSGGYAAGTAANGVLSSGAWASTTPANADLYFKVSLGGFLGSIHGDGTTLFNLGTQATDVAAARSVTNAYVAGSLFCTSGVNVNKLCSSAADPGAHEHPVSDADIDSWKDAAVQGGTNVGDYAVTAVDTTLTSRKIQGNLSITARGATTISGIVWVTGNLTINNMARVSLDASYGAKSGVIIVDGTITVGGGAILSGSGQVGSYLVLVTNSTSASAVSITGGSHTAIVSAHYGTITLSSGAWVRQASGYTVKLLGGSRVAADPELASVQILGSVGGTYSVVSWKELLL